MSARPTVLPGDLFAFATAERAPLYTALLHAFGEANDRLATSLAVEDVREHLASVGWDEFVEDDDLVAALGKMREWRLLDAGQNHAEQYRTAHEYERRNLQYSLTRRGEAALAGHVAASGALEATGALQTAVLEALAEVLGRLVEIAGRLGVVSPAVGPASEPERQAFIAFQELDGHLDAMRSGIRQFNGDLQRLLRAEEVDDSVFAQVKDATVRYLDEYVSRLDERTARIGRAIDRVRESGVERLLTAALRGAELPPHPEPEERDGRWLDHARARWAGLETWFAPDGGADPRAHLLSATARRAIVSLLQVVDRLRAARRRPSSVQADLRTVARLFATAPSAEDVHRVWREAFGLHPARHTQIGHEDPDAVPRGTSWADAPPVPVSALLRESGMTEKHARAARVRDVGEVRRRRAELARAERLGAEAALRALGAGGPVRLSSVGVLDPATFAAFLDLLGHAVGTRPRAEVRRASSSDGRLTVELHLPADGARARVRTATGTLDCPDYELVITVAGAVAVGAGADR
jgi:uncharacterized protein (TIGR02677 family)